MEEVHNLQSKMHILESVSISENELVAYIFDAGNLEETKITKISGTTL